jgi:CTP:molybdopterin cytidylyltransferase MocA
VLAVAAIVLSGGMSKRMGAQQQLPRAADTTLLGHTLTTVRNYSAGETILVLSFGAEEIRHQID